MNGDFLSIAINSNEFFANDLYREKLDSWRQGVDHPLSNVHLSWTIVQFGTNVDVHPCCAVSKDFA